MGYEIAGGLGVKMADPDREVFVMVGDGSYLMMSSEIVTSIQEGVRLTVVLIDNRGFGSIGGLSRSLGSEGFGTAYRCAGRTASSPARRSSSTWPPTPQPGRARRARRHRRRSWPSRARAGPRADRTTVIVVECDPRPRRGRRYESWWDVPGGRGVDDAGRRRRRAPNTSASGPASARSRAAGGG